MELAGIHSGTTAFIAGLITSLHCVGMCGPMACWLTPTRKDEDATTIFAVYQSSRLASYAVLGLIGGALGAWPLAQLDGGAVSLIPWLAVAYFAAVAFRLDRWVKKPLWLIRTGLHLQQACRGRSKVAIAATLGGATPLLPCGPLYFVLTLAALSGSAARGAEFMLAFGLGTLPLLWLAQSQFGWIRGKVSPVSINRIQRTLALAAALVIAWRLRGSLGLGDSSRWLCF